MPGVAVHFKAGHAAAAGGKYFDRSALAVGFDRNDIPDIVGDDVADDEICFRAVDGAGTRCRVSELYIWNGMSRLGGSGPWKGFDRRSASWPLSRVAAGTHGQWFPLFAISVRSGTAYSGESCGNLKLMTVDDFARSSPAVIERVVSWDFESSLSLCAALLLCPVMHGYTFGLEILIHVICAHSTGNARPSAAEIAMVLGTLAPLLDEADEFPRDVFVVNVMTEAGNRRFLTGTWETPEFWVQQALDTLRLAPGGDPFDHLREQVDALLTFSEAAMERNRLKRYTTSMVRPGGAIKLPSGQEIENAVGTVRFSNWVNRELDLFFATRDEARRVGGQQFGNTTLEERPFLCVNESLVIWAMPTATSAAIRMAIVKQLNSTAKLKAFSRTLGAMQTKLFYDDLLRARTRPRCEERLARLPLDLAWMRQAGLEFDGGKIVHAVLLRDDFEDVPGAGVTSLNSSALRASPISQLHLSRSSIQLGFGLHRRGLTVIVMGGLGRAFILPPIATPPNWHICAMHLSDALALKFLEPDWLSYIWRVKDDLASLAEVGLHIHDVGDDIRTIGYWRTKQRIIPLDQHVPAETVKINIDRTFAGNLRAESRIGYDEHASYKPSKRAWFRVAKLQGRGDFVELRALPIYGSIADALNQNLVGVIETAKRSWWLELRRKGDTGDLGLAYLLWDSAMQCCGRLLPLVERSCGRLSDRNIEVLIDVDCPNKEDITGIPRSEELAATSVDANACSITVTLARAFFAALAEPTNRAEKSLATAIIEGVGVLSGAPLPSLSELIPIVFPNDQARFIHLFMAQNVADEVSSIPQRQPTLITNQDSYTAFRGVSSELGAAGKMVIGKEQCQMFLHEAVDILCGRIRCLLKKHDRVSLIQMVLNNIDSVLSEDVRWRRTAAALLSVYNDQQDVISAAQEQSSLRSRTNLTSRVLLEMAICDSPAQGGMTAGRSEYATLMGLINALILTAYNSDAIKYDLVEPSLDVWPNGEFEISRGFYEAILEPYQQGRFNDQFQESAANYDRLFVGRDHKEPEEVFDPHFLSAWQGEFGFTIEDLIKTEEILIRRAHDEQRHVIRITVDEFVRALEPVGLDDPTSRQILDTLVLWPRESWASLPYGFHLRDIEPWKFGRRLSLLRRPILASHPDRSPGTELFYAPGLLHHAIGFTVNSAYAGLITEKYFVSSGIRKWIGAVNDKNGNAFNEDIRTTIASTGIHARANVKMSEFSAAHLGDIDVLAWTPDRDVVFVVECKQLRFARTIAEVGEQLHRFRGRPKDDLWAHCRRLEWIQHHANVLKKRLNLRNGFRLHQFLVTEKLVPMAFVKGLAIPPETVVSANRIVATLQNLPAISRVHLDGVRSGK